LIISSIIAQIVIILTIILDKGVGFRGICLNQNLVPSSLILKISTRLR